MCVGDSNVYGVWMRRDQAWPSQLERIWNAAFPERPVEVLNLGFPGLNSSKLRKSFRGLVMELQPSLVLVMVGSNDMNSVPVPVDSDESVSLRYVLWQHSRVFRFLYMLVTSVRRSDVQVDINYRLPTRRGVARVGDTELDLAGTDRTSAGLPNWHVELAKNLRAMAADAAAVGAAFVVLTYASHQSLYGSANQVLTQIDLPRIGVDEAFARVCPSGACPELFLGDQHPTAQGYGLVAAVVLAGLRDLGIVPRSAPLDAALAELDPSVRENFSRASTAAD
jgi:hypothetical protein